MDNIDLDRMNTLIAKQEAKTITLDEISELKDMLADNLRADGLGWVVDILEGKKETEK
jgi:hypothetical protein